MAGMANDTAQGNGASSFTQAIATARAVLSETRGVCDDGLWGAFRAEVLRSIRTDTGTQQDIDTCWEFLTHSAASRTTLRSQQILEVASSAASVERWARRFWQFPVVDGGGRLHVWRLPIVTKPHSMEIAEHTAHALLQRCQCPEAAKAWLRDAPSMFRCRLHDLSSELAPELKALLEKAPGSASNNVQDFTAPANQLAAAGANALNANLPAPCSDKSPLLREKGAGSPPRPSRAAGCSQRCSDELMEPDAMRDDAESDDGEDATQCYDHSMLAEETNEALCSSLPSVNPGVSGPTASETAAAAIGIAAEATEANPSTPKAGKTEAAAVEDAGVVAARPAADATYAVQANGVPEMPAGRAVVMAPAILEALAAHATLTALACSEGLVAPVMHTAPAALATCATHAAPAALVALVTPVMFAIPAVATAPSTAAGHGTRACSPLHVRAETETPASPAITPPSQMPEASALPLPRWMAACSKTGTCIQTNPSVPAVGCRTLRRLSGKQPDPRNSATGFFPSKLLNVQALGMSHFCDEQGCSTPQGQHNSKRRRSMPKTSPPILTAPGVAPGKPNNMDIQDLGDITASQEHSLFLAAFDSDTPKRSGAAVGLGEQLGGQTSQTSRQKAHRRIHQACKDASLSMGHTLSPLQQGQRIAVIGDGWGQGLGKSGYEAIVTEADDFTYTVVSLGGDCPWTETHVLKQYCVLLDRQVSSPMWGDACVSSPDHCSTNKSGPRASASSMAPAVRQRSPKQGHKAPSLKRRAALSRKSSRAAKRR
mmetsp:Transcript_13271/g.25560  ORF Transcript_13271/g.25560 Transcript_13271/m.25560 type:complete len:773 (-) Transcript_13271:128-2446(-)